MIECFAPVAVAIAANHCPALYGRSTRPDGLVPLLGEAGERLAPALVQALARWSGGARPQVRPLPLQTVAVPELATLVGPIAGNALYTIAGGPHCLLVSVEMHAVMAQLDRTFGGTGQVADELPATLPMSAELLTARLERLMADSLQAALGSDCPLHFLARDNRYAMLAPFADGGKLALLSLEITQPPARSWSVRFAVPIAGLADLLDRRRSAPRKAVDRGPADPRSKPFAEVPLELEAVLVDMAVPLSRLAGLQPGAVLPVAVSRSVPLRIGEAIIGRGTVGDCEDRIALQITQISSGDTQP